MNFTREPIIETIISPREGFTLLVRSSKGGKEEEYYVDALEVVSFGHSFFYRSLERSKSFMVPVSDYEVCEVKEVRLALKNAPHEKNIKIGGGRKESSEEEQEEDSESRQDRKRGRNRRRGRGRDRDREWEEKKRDQPVPAEAETPAQEESASSETEIPPSFTRLIPPPPTLISQTISRYKDILAPPNMAETAEEQPKKEEDLPPTDSTPLFRTVTYTESEQNFLSQRTFLENNNFLT